jgi:hypothetical protein
VPTERDFQQLMTAAIAAGASTAQAGTRTICIQRELEPPLDISKKRTAGTHQTRLPGLPIKPAPPATEDPAVDRAYAVALVPTAEAASEGQIATIPAPYVPYSSKSPIPPRCAIDPHWASSRSAAEHVTRVRLSRPVFANGFAFIDQITECSGLCGSGWLRVFKKQKGRWTEVASRNLFVS